MANQHRSRFPQRAFTKKIDHTLWELSTAFFAGLTAGASAAQFSTVGTTPTTLLRIRGEVMGFLDVAGDPPFGVQISYGIHLVPEGTGTTVLADPFADANASWLLYGTAFIGYEEMVTDVVDIPGITSFRHVIDNKAMRKIPPDTEMQFVVVNTTVGGAKGVNVSYQLRWLQGF